MKQRSSQGILRALDNLAALAESMRRNCIPPTARINYDPRSLYDGGGLTVADVLALADERKALATLVKREAENPTLPEGV